jgi:peptide/nickel transport system substrate-binding protein
VSVALVATATAATAGCGSGSNSEPPKAVSGGTLHVVMVDPTWHALDPQSTWTFPQWEILRCCLVRSLMTYRGAPGTPGTEPVPDLATGPPSVSADGLTWTFHLRRGIHYGPPLEEVEVTAGDVVRALLRNREDQSAGAGHFYMPLVEGFLAYDDSKADSIAGVTAPDRFTLRVRTTRPDTTIAHLFAMPFTAPIPPLPGNPSAPFGVATGHPFKADNDEHELTGAGYGLFLVSTGPYMIEGAPELDFSVAPERQEPLSGLRPAWGVGDEHGYITLVRNPSWNAENDPNRPALADRIEIAITPQAPGVYKKLEAGRVDVVMGGEPPLGVLRRYRSSPSLRDRVITTTGSGTVFVEVNVAQPPFDDRHVRRALALALDRRALGNAAVHWQGYVSGSIATHVAPDSLERSLLSSWTPFPSPSDGGDVAAAREEMSASRYGRGGRCSGEACRDVLVTVPTPETGAIIRTGLAALGIRAIVRSIEKVECGDPKAHVALCVGGWFADFPNAASGFAAWWSRTIGYFANATLLGASPAQLRGWGYVTRHVPSVDGDYQRCAAQAGVRATLCWARLDQLIVEELVAEIPVFSPGVVRLTGPRVAAARLDQAFTEPSLDRLATKG